jgi:hypothetical protein
VGFDAERLAPIAAVQEMARPIGEQAGDRDILQQCLMDNGCHGVEAVLVTMGLLDSGAKTRYEGRRSSAREAI